MLREALKGRGESKSNNDARMSRVTRTPKCLAGARREG
jgi:hypothetical protein